MFNRLTGEEVGPRVSMHAGDDPFDSSRAAKLNEKLWRYMRLPYFEDLLRRGALYFARGDQFRDQLEGRFTEANKAGMSASDESFYTAYGIDRSQAEAASQHEIHRRCTFICCWHRNRVENRRMWSEYTKSPASVVVVSKVASMKRFLPDKIMQWPVLYHPDGYRRSHIFGWNSLLFYKPSSFDYENEFRLLRPLYDGERVSETDPEDLMRYVKIDLGKIVHRVITHPECDAEHKRAVEDLLSRFLPSVRREDSSLSI